jgi:hypothetical protein
MLAQNEQKWKRKHDDLVEEKEELFKKFTSLEEKVRNQTYTGPLSLSCFRLKQCSIHG